MAFPLVVVAAVLVLKSWRSIKLVEPFHRLLSWFFEVIGGAEYFFSFLIENNFILPYPI